MIISGYPLHPSEQAMISATSIKDQELTIIVSMMLIELALLRLSRFKRLASGASASLVGATRRTISLGQEGEFKAPNTPNLETRASVDHH
jgi:hypothetical protein